MRRLSQFLTRPIPIDITSRLPVLEEMFTDIQSVLNDLRLTVVDAPTSASAKGLPGQLAYDSDFIYVCVAQDTWKRAPITTW